MCETVSIVPTDTCGLYISEGYLLTTEDCPYGDAADSIPVCYTAVSSAGKNQHFLQFQCQSHISNLCITKY